MKHVAKGLALAALLATGACANNPNKPMDTGSMNTPTPYRAGLTQPTTQGRDVGSAREPVASGGIAVRESTAPDTGNMALPSAAQGNSSTRRITP